MGVSVRTPDFALVSIYGQPISRAFWVPCSVVICRLGLSHLLPTSTMGNDSTSLALSIFFLIAYALSKVLASSTLYRIRNACPSRIHCGYSRGCTGDGRGRERASEEGGGELGMKLKNVVAAHGTTTARTDPESKQEKITQLLPDHA